MTRPAFLAFMQADPDLKDCVDTEGGHDDILSQMLWKTWQAATAQAGVAWQSIETAPKDGTELLVCRTYEDRRPQYAVAAWDGKEWCDMGDIGWAGMDGENNQPTHWMPLPAPPES